MHLDNFKIEYCNSQQLLSYFDERFYLVRDASKIAVSSILMQKIDGKFKPIQFYSRKLRDAETRYHSLKSELLAIYESIKHFKYYLWGRDFTVFSDAKALTNHLDLNKIPDVTSRWILELEDYSFEIKHITGQSHPADYLSRCINNIQLKQKLISDLFRVDEDMKLQNFSKHQHEDEN